MASRFRSVWKKAALPCWTARAGWFPKHRAGAPLTWHSRNPEDYGDARLLTHTVEASVPLPEAKGTYTLAFYLRNSMGTGAGWATSSRLPTAVRFYARCRLSNVCRTIHKRGHKRQDAVSII